MEFAVPMSTPGFDNGPYITAGHWITKDPETGKRNVGNYRGLIKGPTAAGLMSGTPQDLSTHWEKCRKLGKPLEVAIVVGTIPAVSYCATQKVPPDIDELALAGGLMGAPVKLVKCQTVDLEVPATSEIVLEGIIPTNYMEEEGPYGESMGYVDPRTLEHDVRAQMRHPSEKSDLGFDHQPSHAERKLQDQSDGHGDPGQALYRQQGLRLRQRSAHDRTAGQHAPLRRRQFEKAQRRRPVGRHASGARLRRSSRQNDCRRRRRHQRQRPGGRHLGDHASLATAQRCQDCPRSAVRRDAHRHGGDASIESL